MDQYAHEVSRSPEHNGARAPAGEARPVIESLTIVFLEVRAALLHSTRTTGFHTKSAKAVPPPATAALVSWNRESDSTPLPERGGDGKTKPKAGKRRSKNMAGSRLSHRR